ncbi:MAG: NAD-dependent epimerase/dehydratase family protein [Mariniphaga sp.]|nr:NAD-dependent epimerase/dehydratase family protein [Mariniphaga sp.]
MKYFLTGATGFIGKELAKQFLQKGEIVHALVRSPEKAQQIDHKNLRLFQGDITNKESIQKAMVGCDYVFHLAGYAKPWSKDKNIPFEINVKGTINVLEAALQNNIKRVIFTSTAGILKPSDIDEATDENSPNPESYLTAYEETKMEAERRCSHFMKKGLEIVIVNPSRVYGPGLLSKSNSVTTIIKKYNEGKWRFLPGDGSEIGNYVFIDDIVSGLKLALEKGQPGERYILGGTNISFNDFFNVLSEETGNYHRLFKLPLCIMMLVSRIMLLLANNFGIEPLITPQWVKRYSQNRVLSSKKAINKLGYSITPINEGIRKTLIWLKTEKL